MTTARMPQGHDLDWVYANLEQLEKFESQWIAVLNGEVIASGPTATAVYSVLKARNIADALLFQMPTDVHQKVYFVG